VFPGNESYEEQLRRRSGEGRLAGRVSFAGFVDDVWLTAEAHHVWVVPSRTDEPFGNTAVEAMLAGRPLVATRSGGLVEAAAGFAASRLCEPGDPAGLAAAIADLDHCWLEVTAAIRRDTELARQRHSPSGYQTALLEVLDRR
jgi:glycosyltransferase involved in cell wall biosynthesis